jgi:hypothetical protein
MNRKTNLLALLGAAAVTVLIVAGLSNAASNAAPTLQSAPTISGTPVVGETLSVTSGSWSSSSTLHYSYQWRRCNSSGGGCSNISGADSSSYQVRSADRGHTLRARVTARNADGSATTDSNPTAVVKAAAPAPAPTGCPSGTGAIDASQLSLPARLNVDNQTSSPDVVSRSTTTLTLRFHVSACGGRSVANALVYATAVPFEQFSVPAEVATDSTGWAQVTMHQAGAFPASPRQQLLAVFVRARKTGENVLGGVSTRRLVSFPVRL